MMVAWATFDFAYRGKGRIADEKDVRASRCDHGVAGGDATGLAQQGKPGIERLYVLYCGDIALNDASSFTPGASGPGALSPRLPILVSTLNHCFDEAI
jgi:hypothetical protein